MVQAPQQIIPIGIDPELVNEKVRKLGILLVDDHPMIRRGMFLILQGQTDMEVIGEASDGSEAIEAARRLKPDVVVMDIEMPHVSGIEATKIISDMNPNTSILILTAYDREDLLFQALQAGASGYVLKGMDAEDLLAAIRTVNAGDVCITPSMATKLVGDYLKSSSGGEDSDPYNRLSTREREVLPLLAEGNSQHNIAEMLHVSTYTVQTYRQRIMRKLDIHNGTELLRYALRKGLISVD